MGEAGDGCRGVDVTAAFEPRARRDECGMAGRWMGCVVGDVGDEAGGSFRAGDCARLKARDSSRQAQGSRELSSHTADARTVGLGRAEVGGGLLCGHWALGPSGKRIPPLGLAKHGGPIQLLGARACPGHYDRLRRAARTGPGLWGSSSRFRWTLGSGHPGPGPGYLPTQHLSLLRLKMGLGLGLGPADVWSRSLLVYTQQAASSSEMCVCALVACLH